MSTSKRSRHVSLASSAEADLCDFAQRVTVRIPRTVMGKTETDSGASPLRKSPRLSSHAQTTLIHTHFYYDDLDPPGNRARAPDVLHQRHLESREEVGEPGELQCFQFLFFAYQCLFFNAVLDN